MAKLLELKIILSVGCLYPEELRSVCADLGPGETTWPILNGFPDFKDQ